MLIFFLADVQCACYGIIDILKKDFKVALSR